MLSVEYTDKVGEIAKEHGLKLHIDGARIFNAAVVSILSFNKFNYQRTYKLLYCLVLLKSHINVTIKVMKTLEPVPA